MAGNLRIHARVVERACRNRRDDSAGAGATGRRRTVIAPLARRDGPDDQPYQQDKPTDSPVYLRKLGGSRRERKRRAEIVLSCTPCPVNTCGRETRYATHSALGDTSSVLVAHSRRRCIVCADDPGWLDRAARACGARSVPPSAGPGTGWRRSIADYQSLASRSDVVHLQH